MRQTIQPQILLVDHDEYSFRKLNHHLSSQARITWTQSPLEALSLLSKDKYDVVICQESFEEISGIHLLMAAKSLREDVVTILLTNHVNDDLELQALESDVNGVFSKDRSPKVVAHYLRMVLKKGLPLYGSHLLFSSADNLSVNRESYEVIQNGKLVALTPKEFEILVLFLENKNRVLTRQEMIRYLWDESENLDERTIDVHIKRLRSKLVTRSIVSVRGVGYRWNERQL